MTGDDLRGLAASLRDSGRVGEFLELLADGAARVFRHTERCVGSVFVRPMQFAKAGERVAGHRHNYDHATLLVRGALHARTWDEDPDGRRFNFKERSFAAVSEINVPAGRSHEFTALTDGALALCVFAHRDHDGTVIDAYAGWHEATE